jgi:hypothetical protein
MEPLYIGMTRATDAKSTFLLPEKLPDRRARGEVLRALSSQTFLQLAKAR